jgi:FKBP12-rapamycin complex-associated protein
LGYCSCLAHGQSLCRDTEPGLKDKGDYDAMADYLAFHPKGTSKSLYKAIIDVNSNSIGAAFQHISKAQTLAYDELQACVSIAPVEAGKALAKTEYLVELSEVMTYKSQPEQRQPILTSWRARFKRSHPDSNSWLRRLQIWSLACEPTVWELQVSYLDCAKLCESQGKHEAAQRIISLVTPEVTPAVSQWTSHMCQLIHRGAKSSIRSSVSCESMCHLTLRRQLEGRL